MYYSVGCRFLDENKEHFSLLEDQKFFTLNCHLTKEILVFNKKFELVEQTTSLAVPFVDAFDALAMQVAEDLVIHKVPQGQLNPLKKEEDKKDYAAAIHLCHCNGWDAEWGIGQTFDFVHKKVPRIDKIVPNATRMMLSFLTRGFRFERIAAISFKTSDVLNRHSDDIENWNKEFNVDEPFMNIRVERQTVKGFKKSAAFLFTIRTFLYDMNLEKSDLNREVKVKRLNAIKNVFENPNEKSYAYTILLKFQESVLSWCKSQKI